MATDHVLRAPVNGGQQPPGIAEAQNPESATLHEVPTSLGVEER